MVDGVRRDEARAWAVAAMPSAPCHQLGHVGIVDIGQPFILAEKLDEQCEAMLSVVGVGKVLPNLLPIAFGHVIEPQR
jgi:hypothetical protein